jgi:hypothetical protein
MRLAGTEKISIEIEGSLDPAATEAFAKRLPLRPDGRMSILALEMRGLGLRDVKLPGLNYREVLHRLSVNVDGAPAWLALRCDLDSALVRRTATRVIRYPVHDARISISASEIRSDAFSARLRIGDEAMPHALRRTFVIQKERLFEIPWDEKLTTTPREAVVEDVEMHGCEEVFGGPISLETRAIVHRERRHFCASAVRV